MINLVIDKNDAGQRLDRFLRKYLHRAPLSAIYKMIRKDIKVNGKRAVQKTVLKEGDELILYLSEEQLRVYTERISRQPSARRTFRIIYEDENLIIVNKPAGLLTHGNSQEKKNTLVNQVVDYLIQQGEFIPGRSKSFSPAAVNRLDRNTSGMVIFGKRAEALRDAAAMIREKNCIEKRYLAVVQGNFEEHTILTGAAKKNEEKNQVSVSRDPGGEGRTILTEVTPVAFGSGMTLLDVNLITGRTHQIRAHLASEGFPVIGDPKYGDRGINKEMEQKDGLKSQFLHAWRLEFREAYGSLSGMKGKSLIDPLPESLERMACRLFGNEWKSIYDS